MQLSEIQEEVIVTAAPPLIDKTSTDTSHHFTSEDLEKVPAQNRTVVDVTKFIPGVSGVRINTRSGTSKEGQPSFRGEGEEGNNWIIDGLSISGVRLRNSGLKLNFDSLDEIQVISDPFSPEFGSSFGGIINMVTKSGSNDLKGEISLIFMDKKLHFSYVIGVSMGACNAASYTSRQRERNRIVNVRYVNDARYMSYLRLVTKGELFGMAFIFDTIPNSLVPFDFKTFMESEQTCFTTATDCKTGEAVYYEKGELGADYMKILQASSSLPFISKPVHYQGRVLMDGGLSDPIPIQKAIHDGNSKNVLVLTRPKRYRKKPFRLSILARIRHPGLGGVYSTLRNRHLRYNATVEYLDRLEEEAKVFVIRPRLPLDAGRIERNKDKLYAVYDQGYADARASYKTLCSYLMVL